MTTAPSVFAYYLTNGGRVEHAFMRSLIGVTHTSGRRMVGGWPHHRVTRTMELPDARNEMTAAFLNSDASWMWQVDSDMGFEPDTLERMLKSAEMSGASVLGALCFMWSPASPDGMGGYRGMPVPTLHEWDGSGFGMWSLAAQDYPRGQIIPVGATGAACLLVHRTAALAMQQQYGDEWWTPVRYSDGRTLGEDLSFFYRLLHCTAAKPPAFVDTAIKTTHAKTVWIGERDYELHRGVTL